jgi:hypothetical protein
MIRKIMRSKWQECFLGRKEREKEKEEERRKKEEEEMDREELRRFLIEQHKRDTNM